MIYFAIGEDNGGAGERRLGPFDTPKEAEDAGMREAQDSNGAFVFRGVVDEANNQVFTDFAPVSTNSVVMNALAANRRVAKNASYANESEGDLAVVRCVKETRAGIDALIKKTDALYDSVEKAPLSAQGNKNLETLLNLLTGLVHIKGRF